MVQSVQKSPQKQIQAYSMLKSRRNFRKYSIYNSIIESTKFEEMFIP